MIRNQPSASPLRWWLLGTGLLAAAVWGAAVSLANNRAAQAEARLRATTGTTTDVNLEVRERFQYGSGTLTLYTGATRDHSLGTIRYALRPPVGGTHTPEWQNCGAYRQPISDARAVHSLEHGAVWITYAPQALSARSVVALEALTQRGRVLVSPYPAQGAPIVANAWGLQWRSRARAPDRVDFETLRTFIADYELKAPEPNAPCAGGYPSAN